MNTQTSPQSLLHQAAQIQHMERGKLCILRQGPQGPYYSHQTWENGKNLSHYVPQDQVSALQQAIAGYELFENLTQQYAQLIIGKTRAELAAGLKKKTPSPRSSLPKTRKSTS
jgi:hypothetical protein